MGTAPDTATDRAAAFAADILLQEGEIVGYTLKPPFNQLLSNVEPAGAGGRARQTVCRLCRPTSTVPVKRATQSILEFNPEPFAAPQPSDAREQAAACFQAACSFWHVRFPRLATPGNVRPGEGRLGEEISKNIDTQPKGAQHVVVLRCPPDPSVARSARIDLCERSFAS